MSDAFTYIERDEKISEQLNKIRKLEERFHNEPSPELAKQIIEEVDNYTSMPRGYMRSPDIRGSKKVKKTYEKYLSKHS